MRFLSAALAAAATFGVTPVHAEETDVPPWYAPDSSVPVTFRNETTTTSYTVRDPGGAGVLDTCDQECTVWLMPGRYVLRVDERDGYSGGDRTLIVKEPRTYVVTQGRTTAKTTGLVLGITGTVLLPLGFAALTPAVMSANCHGDCGGVNGGVALAGLGAIVVGAILTPVGWAMYNRHRVRLRPEDSTL
jgi:hypothetical protein